MRADSVRWILAAMLAVSCGVSADSPAPATRPAEVPASQPAKAAPLLRVASYNINYGNPDLKAVVTNILKADADIVVLQETNAASRTYLARALGRDYPIRLFRNAPAAGGFGFLARVPVKDVRYAPPAQGGWFGNYSLTAVHDRREVRIVSIHLMPTIPPRHGGIVAFWTEFQKTAKVREQEVLALLAGLPEDLPVLLAGDFNAIPLSKVRRLVMAAGLGDAMAGSADPTWSWTIGKTQLSLRLDYLFHSPSLRSAKPEILQAEGSDHYLIHADFTWAPPEPAADPDPKAPAGDAVQGED